MQAVPLEKNSCRYWWIWTFFPKQTQKRARNLHPAFPSSNRKNTPQKTLSSNCSSGYLCTPTSVPRSGNGYCSKEFQSEVRIPKHQPVVLRVTLTFRRSQEACEKLMVWSSRIEKKPCNPSAASGDVFKKVGMGTGTGCLCLSYRGRNFRSSYLCGGSSWAVSSPSWNAKMGYSVQIRYRIIYQMSCYDPCPLTLRKLAANGTYCKQVQRNMSYWVIWNGKGIANIQTARNSHVWLVVWATGKWIINGNFRNLNSKVPTIYKAYVRGKGMYPQNMALYGTVPPEISHWTKHESSYHSHPFACSINGVSHSPSMFQQQPVAATAQKRLPDFQ